MLMFELEVLIMKDYVAYLDNKKRITLRGATYQYYNVKEYGNGCIILEPRELSVSKSISSRTLADMDRAVSILNVEMFLRLLICRIFQRNNKWMKKKWCYSLLLSLDCIISCIFWLNNLCNSLDWMVHHLLLLRFQP